MKFAAVIARHGPDAVAISQLLTGDYYVFNKLMRGLIGSNNLDTNSRLCMSSAVARQAEPGRRRAALISDIRHTQALFISGSNTFAHPIAFRRVEGCARARPVALVVVIDPRRADTAEAAGPPAPHPRHRHRPCTMLHVMLWGLGESRLHRPHRRLRRPSRRSFGVTPP